MLNLIRNSRTPKHWALCANPKRYRIADAVRSLEIDFWNVGRSDVRADDTAVLWQTLDGSGRRGVVAFATVLAEPKSLPDTDNPYWTDEEDGSKPLPRVPVRYDVPDVLPIWIDDKKHGALLRSLSMARAQGGTVFRLTEEQWEGLKAAVGGWHPTPIEEVEATAQRSASGNGQGYGLSGPERRAVEVHAMRQAKKYFKKSWPEVRDVSSRCSFDLLCRDGAKELRVEVKGTTTAGQSVVLTKNEVSLASEPGYALFVVREIELNRGELKARGGLCVVFEPWKVSSANIVPIQYRCELQLEEGEPVDFGE